MWEGFGEAVDTKRFWQSQIQQGKRTARLEWGYYFGRQKQHFQEPPNLSWAAATIQPVLGYLSKSCVRVLGRRSSVFSLGVVWCNLGFVQSEDSVVCCAEVSGFKRRVSLQC